MSFVQNEMVAFSMLEAVFVEEGENFFLEIVGARFTSIYVSN